MFYIFESFLITFLTKVIKGLEPDLEKAFIQEIKSLGCKLLGHCESELAKKEKS